MKVQFDIKYRPQIESGEYKVVTGDDRPVRIISWDKKVFGGHIEIVALVPTPMGDTETVQLYCPDGTLIAAGWNEKFKLFILTPEPELTEFEQAVRDCIAENLTTHGREMSSTVFIDEGTTKKLASELFGLARTQLQTEGLVTMEHLNISCEAEYQSGLADGKNEALNDLPRWKKIGRGNNYSSEVKFAINGRYLEMNDTLNDVYEVALSNLKKLPKED